MRDAQRSLSQAAQRVRGGLMFDLEYLEQAGLDKDELGDPPATQLGCQRQLSVASLRARPAFEIHTWRPSLGVPVCLHACETLSSVGEEQTHPWSLPPAKHEPQQSPSTAHLPLRSP